MTKRYSILQRKLQELESELSQRFSLPATTACSQLLLEDIEQRFAFLKNLLSAEVASHPSKPTTCTTSNSDSHNWSTTSARGEASKQYRFLTTRMMAMLRDVLALNLASTTTGRPPLKKTRKGFPTAWSTEKRRWWSFPEV